MLTFFFFFAYNGPVVLASFVEKNVEKITVGIFLGSLFCLRVLFVYSFPDTTLS